MKKKKYKRKRRDSIQFRVRLYFTKNSRFSVLGKKEEKEEKKLFNEWRVESEERERERKENHMNPHLQLLNFDTLWSLFTNPSYFFLFFLFFLFIWEMVVSNRMTLNYVECRRNPVSPTIPCMYIAFYLRVDYFFYLGLCSETVI